MSHPDRDNAALNAGLSRGNNDSTIVMEGLIDVSEKAVWFNLDSLIDPSITGGRVPSYKKGSPTGQGHLALEDNAGRTR